MGVLVNEEKYSLLIKSSESPIFNLVVFLHLRGFSPFIYNIKVRQIAV